MAHFEIKDLSFSYPTANGKLALKNINLKIERGEYLTVWRKERKRQDNAPPPSQECSRPAWKPFRGDHI